MEVSSRTATALCACLAIWGCAGQPPGAEPTLDRDAGDQTGQSDDAATPPRGQTAPPMEADGAVACDGAGCAQPDGGADAGPSVPEPCEYVPVADEQTRTRYGTDSVPFGDSCQSEQQVRRCLGGMWSSWSGSFDYTDCAPQSGRPCDQVAHGEQQSELRYEAASVPFGSSCQSETRTRACHDGLWSSWSGSFTLGACVVQAAAGCGGTPHGGQQTRLRYQAASVPHDQSCVSQVQARSCNNGSLSGWSGSFGETDCTVMPAPACGATPHGGQESRVRYEAASVPHDQSCVSQVQYRSCSAGSFSAWSGSYSEGDCSSTAAPGCGETPHGGQQSRVRYEAASVAYDESCVSQVQYRDCDAGSFSAWSGSYSESDCSVTAPLDCGSISHGGQDSRVRYLQAEVFTPSACISEVQSRPCLDGSFGAWSGSYAHADCSQCVDSDGDKRGAGCSMGPDCDDGAPNIYPDAVELDWNQVDENCNGHLGRHLEQALVYQARTLATAQLDAGKVYAGFYSVARRSLGDLSTALGNPPVRQLNDSPIQGGLQVRLSGWELQLFDVDAAEQPIGRLNLQRSGSDPTWSSDGELIFVRAHNGELPLPNYVQLVDVSDPTSPSLLGTAPVDCDSLSATHGGGSALHVICRKSSSVRLYSFDISDPMQVTQADLDFLPGSCVSRSFSDQTLYCTEDTRVDLSDPLAPVVLAGASGVPSWGALSSMAAYPSGAYYKSPYTNQLCHLADGSDQTSCVSLDDSLDDHKIVGVDGDVLVLSRDSEMVAFDISDPDQPLLRSDRWHSIPDTRSGVLKDGVVLSSSHVNKVNVTLFSLDPAYPDQDPVPLLVTDSAWGGDVALDGDRLYIGGSDLSVVDVSDPAAPLLLGVDQDPSNEGYIAARSNVLWGQDRFGELLRANVMQPDSVSFSKWGVFAPVIPALGQMVIAGGDLWFRYQVGANTAGVPEGSGIYSRALGMGLDAEFSEAGIMLEHAGRLLWGRRGSDDVHYVVTDPSDGSQVHAVSLPGPSYVPSVAVCDARIFVSSNDSDGFYTLDSYLADDVATAQAPASPFNHGESFQGEPGLLLSSGSRGIVLWRVLETPDPG